MKMQAVILAAGVGSRLQTLSGGTPKCLIEIGGRPLIFHQLEALADHGIGPVLCVLGYRADDVRRVIGERANVIVNEDFERTNSLYSLWLAREWIKGPFILLNSDLFFDPRVLDRVLEESGNVLAYDSTSSRGREQTKVAIKQRRVVDLGKDLPVSSARGESLGLLRFDAEGARALLETADALVKDGREDAWVIEATRAVCHHVPVYGVNIAGLNWTEIDFPYDLDVARREVWPAIWKGRWRNFIYWKRTRWAALGAAALIVALSGWFANGTVGPARIDWETVPLQGGVPVRVERRDKLQRWWLTTPETPVSAEVAGPDVQVQVRLVLPDSALDTLGYVVEVTLDGQPYVWDAFTAIPDQRVHLPGSQLGDRDRMSLTLPPGVHQLGVRLIAGQADRLLVRLRQPEDRED